MSGHRLVAACSVLALVVAACGAASTTTSPAASGPALRSISAPTAAITVDGNAADWAGIAGLDLTLEGIEGVETPVESKQATIRVAHDAEFVYAMFEVKDDYNWSDKDPHLSGSPAVMWAVVAKAGPHMGPDDKKGEGPRLGMVDIWHWELECAAGKQTGGDVSDPGDGDPGNDAGCNFDDEWATGPEDREDDNGTGAENSLLGVWTHSNPTADGAGSWFFEIRRPLQTGDAGDAQFAVGSAALLALAYWDSDQTAAGWEDDGHAQSSNQGWIEVTLK